MAATKMTMGRVFKVLLDGGFIAEHCPYNGTKRFYSVIVQNGGPYAGHITEKQFDELVTEGVIESTHESKTDKRGAIYNFYELSKKERES